MCVPSVGASRAHNGGMVAGDVMWGGGGEGERDMGERFILPSILPKMSQKRIETAKDVTEEGCRRAVLAALRATSLQ